MFAGIRAFMRIHVFLSQSLSVSFGLLLRCSSVLFPVKMSWDYDDCAWSKGECTFYGSAQRTSSVPGTDIQCIPVRKDQRSEYCVLTYAHVVVSYKECWYSVGDVYSNRIWCMKAVIGQNGSGQNGTDKMVRTKWYGYNHQLMKQSSFHCKYDFRH